MTPKAKAKAAETKAETKKNGGAKSLFTALKEYMVGEGKGPHDVVTLDDITHAESLGGAAPNAKPKKPAKDSE